MYFGTNLKMYGTPAETKAFVQTLEAYLPQREVQCFVLPPFTSLQGLKAHASKLWLGAQNMHWADKGAYTGEISPVMLTALNLDLVMLGHAERRHSFGETDEMIAKKVQSALHYGLRVLLCLGETLEQKQQGRGEEVVVRQLKTALQEVEVNSNLLVAYEPVWAIGEEGKEAKPQEVQESLQFIRQTLQTLFGHQHIPILYGGSVNEANCAAYAELLDMDGLFVGRAARKASGFFSIMERSLKVHQTAKKSAESLAKRSV